MEERRREARHRTLRGGKIVFNDRRSVVDCLVRNLSAGGACLQVNTSFGLPATFELLIDGNDGGIAADMVWATQTRVGAVFRGAVSDPGDGSGDASEAPAATALPSLAAPTSRDGVAPGQESLTLRAALDEIDIGIVLLDAETRAQFINRAFRRMWRLPDSKAESKPPFVALMYHGRDTRAYAVRPDEIDSYVAERVAHIKAGYSKPIDLRLASGEVVRMQCTVLPAGGRMLCYTYVTDIVGHADELETLRGALDNVQQGVTILDPFLNVKFMNRAVRELWGIPDDQADQHPSYIELVSEVRLSGEFNVPPEQLSRYVAGRIAVVRAGDPTPMDIPLRDGRVIRSQCTVLPAGGRMLMYSDVTDLVRRADRFEQLATTDSLTGLINRRQFDVLAEAEWGRFQRYQRPLSMLLLDIDWLKRVNDEHGHGVGDRAIAHVAMLCNEERRSSDVVARIGGDEFAILLPETDLIQARLVAERLWRRLADNLLVEPTTGGSRCVACTLSMGVAQATLSMPSIDALMKRADAALYKAKAAGRNCIVCDDGIRSTEHRAAAE